MKAYGMQEKLYIDKFGNRYWYNDDGYLHRNNGPAVEWNSGSKTYAKDGRIIRHSYPLKYNDNISQSFILCAMGFPRIKGIK